MQAAFVLKQTFQMNVAFETFHSLQSSFPNHLIIQWNPIICSQTLFAGCFFTYNVFLHLLISMFLILKLSPF